MSNIHFTSIILIKRSELIKSVSVFKFISRLVCAARVYWQEPSLNNTLWPLAAVHADSTDIVGVKALQNISIIKAFICKISLIRIRK